MFHLSCLVVVVAVMATLKYAEYIPSYLAVFLASIFYLVTRHWKWLKILSKTFKRDVYAIGVGIKIVFKIFMMVLTNTFIRDLLYSNVHKHPNKLALVDAETNQNLTFKEVEELSHKIANVFYEAGYRRRDVVALYMENRVEYVFICFGLSMIGVTTSLIDFNLHGDKLRHCIDVSNCKAIIFTDLSRESIRDIQKNLKIKTYCFDTCEDMPSSCILLHELMKSASCLPPPRNPDIMISDTLLHMYTSGTTGFSKAVIITGLKVLTAVVALPAMGGIKGSDITYAALPLYHGSGWYFANACFFTGCTTIIKKKFSASQFMGDCCKHNVTVVNYIGEICRYLLCQPKSEFDELNSIRLAVGNGLRASIWKEFKERFQIEKVVNFYAATEGNMALYLNTEDRVGAVGFRPLLLPSFDAKLVKIDDARSEILRDATGLAIEAEIGEPGQAVGKITKFTKFDGYIDAAETQKKIAHDIFSHGDSAFLSGDMLIRDEEGYYYFHDRIDDTFRWKGKNVSTNEVEGLVSKVTKLTDVCVYGVRVPGKEGKAGMACIVDPDKHVNIEELPKAFNQLLPMHAHPQFIRISKEVDVTGTFKFQKSKLKEDSYTPEKCLGDKLYYLTKEENKFLTLDCKAYEEIMRETISF